MLEQFLEAYDAVLVLDTETTGISCRKDEIIELAVLKAGQADGALCELETMDEFIRRAQTSGQDCRADGHHRADAARRRD